MTTLYLVRHGETDWNRLGLLQGTRDIPLNARGHEQAAALARALQEVRWNAAYTSPLRRAVDTAAAVLRGSDVVPTTLPELRELSYGLWQGRGPAARARCASGLERRWREQPWTVRFPGGETLAEVRARAAAALDRITAAHPDGTVLVSGHGHFNRVLLIHALAWAPQRFWEIEQPNGGCLVVKVGEVTRVPNAPGGASPAAGATLESVQT